MKNNFLLFITKKLLGTTLIVVMFFSYIVVSCDSDDIKGNLYTFTDKMMGEYLRESAEYSEFVKLLDTTKVMGLLNAYGTYTCFAPTNEAMKQFYQLKGRKSLADFPFDSLKLIAYDHIINGTEINEASFILGRQAKTTMSDRYISVSYDSGNTYINKLSKIIEKDIFVHNGVMHKIDQVINPTQAGIVEAISKFTDFSLFYDALIATRLSDSLVLDKDDSYNPALYKSLVTVPLQNKDWYYQEVPQTRKFGYTVFMERNETLKIHGITNMESMKQYAASVYDEVYPEDANIKDVTDRRNSLNRFIAYHLINKQLSNTSLIDLYDTNHMLKTQNMYEYLEPMCPNTLIEIKKDRLLNQTNIINYNRETGKSIQIVTTLGRDNDATNGVFHEINEMLVYSKEVETELSTKRLRFDAASFFPELTNNNMRGSRFLQNTNKDNYNDPSLHYQLPRGYIQRITSSEQTVVGYLAGYHKFQDYMGDEIFLGATKGNLYDFSIITPPVPKGTYEIRFGYLTNGKRGVAQLYIDDVPAGVPLNLNKVASDVSIGWEKPGSVSTDLNGFENDKMMRNRGYMKAPACFKVITEGWTSGENARYCDAALRKILGIYTFDKAENHKLTVKGLSGGEFMFDYLEFVPTSALESEDIY
ncbi:MAG: fasciclin domain-containing protein [Paludibacteraceae bacterium]